MTTPNVVLQPDNLDQEFGDLRRKIRALETAAPIGQPHVYIRSVDASHHMFLDFAIPNGLKYTTAKLTLKMRLYRSNSSFAGGNTGNQSANHVHDEGSHRHRSFQFSSSTPNGDTAHKFFTWISDTTQVLIDMLTSSNGDLYTEATSPGNTGGNSADHFHAVGASSLGVSEGTSSTATAIGVDGVDKTALLGGGPWGDTVDLDLSAVLPTGDGNLHYVELTTAAQVEITAILKLA